MFRSSILAGLLLGAFSSWVTAQEPNPVSREAKIRNALSAGPTSITEEATVMDYDNTILREGSNGWICFPDSPQTPANDPACLDEQWVNFFAAWAARTEPEITAVGFGYMLQGGSAASLTDPFATEPPAGEQWKHGPPHLMMIAPNAEAYRGLPTSPTGGPWLMWAGTPYRHVMIPVAARMAPHR